MQFPGADAPFQFRLKDAGTETVIAICNATGKDADGIKHDFKTRQFTDLGNYRGFLARQIVVEAKEKVAEGKKDEVAARRRRMRHRRRRQATSCPARPSSLR